MTSPGIAVVTGGAGGIGRAIAVRLVARGYGVVLTDLDGDAVARVAAEVGAVTGLAQDVRSPGSHRDVAAEAARHGRLVAWFNNAGVVVDGPLTQLTDDQVRAQVEVNLLGVLWGTRAALDAFGPGGGDIVNTASLSAHGPVPGLAVYAATKAAVVSLSTSIAAELPAAVRLHAVCPDGVDTRMVAGMDHGGIAKALVHSGGRLLTADEAAAAAVSLLGRRRIVKSLPVWRGALSRTTALAPSVASHALGTFTWLGRRVMERRDPGR